MVSAIRGYKFTVYSSSLTEIRIVIRREDKSLIQVPNVEQKYITYTLLYLDKALCIFAFIIEYLTNDWSIFINLCLFQEFRNAFADKS